MSLVVPIDVASVVVVDAVVAGFGVDAVAVDAASWRDEPKRREDRPVVIQIPAAANPTAPDGSAAVALRYRNASRPSPTRIRLILHSFLLIKEL